jgi:predicted O-methyltransferase YrrM
VSPPFWQILHYPQFFLSASGKKGHGIHSPFAFEFIRNVLNDSPENDPCSEIELLRSRMLKDQRVLEIIDWGAGAIPGSRRIRTLAAIARHSAINQKMGRLLFRIARHYQPKRVLELGSSLGISASYLGWGNPLASITTMEGSPELADQARKNIQELGLKGIQVLTGNFDQLIPGFCSSPQIVDQGLDLAFVDGNHRQEPTFRYFEQLAAIANPESLIVLDDIHWSGGMERAWTEIRSHPRTMMSFDLFFMGLVFFRPSFKTSQHFSLRF